MGELVAESCQEIHEERSVEILAELVEDEPVPKAALVEVVLNLDYPGRPLEVSVHPEVDQLEPDCGRPAERKVEIINQFSLSLSTILQSLDDPVDNPESPDNGQEEEPPPEDEEHLVVDHVGGENTDGVDVLLLAPTAPPPVVTAGCKMKKNQIS